MAINSRRVVIGGLVAGLIISLSGLMMVPVAGKLTVVGTAWGLVEMVVAGEVGARPYGERGQR